jgi:hypothetical protein
VRGLEPADAQLNQRMLGYKGPAQPAPTLGDALNAGYLYLEVKCLGCDTHQIYDCAPKAFGESAFGALRSVLMGTRINLPPPLVRTA